MITEYKSALYRISYQGVSMIENALGNPNLIQISVVLGCSIIVSPQQGGGIQYLPNGESRKWFLYGVNTKLNKTGHHFIYARLNRDGDQAYLIFSVNDYAIDGTINGENPIKANGKMLVIDGGFSRPYHLETGIAGYTLVYHSRGFQLVQHEPFESTAKAIKEGLDIKSTTIVVELNSHRQMVKDTDKGKELQQQITDLMRLLYAYRNGYIKESERE